MQLVPKDLVEWAKGYFHAYETGDRDFIADNMAPGFTFTSPFDDAIGREAYFARCWPHADIRRRFDFVAVMRSGDQVLVVYDATMGEASAVHPAARFRNAELMTFEDGRLKSVQVFFGDPPGGLSRRDFAVRSGAG